MTKRLITIVAVLMCAAMAGADTFETVGMFMSDMAPDARSEGMGQAFTAVAEGPAGQYWNPAAPIQGRTVTVGYHNADQTPEYLTDVSTFDLTYTALSAAAEVGFLRLGAWQRKLVLNDFTARTAYQPDGEFIVDPWYRFRAAGASLDLGRLLFGEESTVLASAGVNFKRFETGSNGETTFETDDKDLGAMVGSRHYLGDSDDVHRGWVSWRVGGVLVNADEAETLEQSGRVGVAVEGRHGWTYWLGHRIRWLLTADWQKTKEGQDWSDETLARYGAELTMGLVSGRVGRIDASGMSADGTTYGGGLVFASPRTPFGFRGDYASVPLAAADGLWEAQRLARYSAAVWVNF